MVIVGVEKFKLDVKEVFWLKFGLEIYEGYGVIEIILVVSVNMLNIFDLDMLKEFSFNKVGFVGMLLLGMIIKIVDLNMLGELFVGEDGLILIGGG